MSKMKVSKAKAHP